MHTKRFDTFFKKNMGAIPCGCNSTPTINLMDLFVYVVMLLFKGTAGEKTFLFALKDRNNYRQYLSILSHNFLRSNFSIFWMFLTKQKKTGF